MSTNSTYPYYLHPSSFLDGDAFVGAGTKIWHFCHIMPGARIGKNCILGQNVFVGEGVIIGSNVKIQNNVSVYSGVELEDDVFVGPSAVFTNVINPRSFIERKDAFGKTLVQKGASIGANATILCGRTIGTYALIGAGATVTRDVKGHAIVTGVPAKQSGWACRCGNTLRFKDDKARCTHCGNVSMLSEDRNSLKFEVI